VARATGVNFCVEGTGWWIARRKQAARGRRTWCEPEQPADPPVRSGAAPGGAGGKQGGVAIWEGFTAHRFLGEGRDITFSEQMPTATLCAADSLGEGQTVGDEAEASKRRPEVAQKIRALVQPGGSQVR